MSRKKIYLVAGELSGDTHGADLIKELKRRDPSIDIRFMGGDMMKEAGGIQSYHYKDIAIMGFVEVIKNLKKINGYLKMIQSDIEKYSPDEIIFIDFPGFNLRLAKQLHQKFNLHYYIAPKAWAWNKSRVHKLRKYFKTVNCILPFEIDFFQSYDVNAIYTGNPSVNQVELYKERNTIEQAEYIALFPGSRKQEVERILPVMLEGIKKIEGVSFRISKASNLDISIYEPYVDDIAQLYSDNYKLLSGAKAALVTSGTATLETALFDVPQVVCYIGSKISYTLARLLVSLKYISLVNLIEDREIIKELIQDQCNPETIKNELEMILSEKGKKSILEGYQSLKSKLGQLNSSNSTIENILTFSS